MKKVRTVIALVLVLALCGCARTSPGNQNTTAATKPERPVPTDEILDITLPIKPTQETLDPSATLPAIGDLMNTMILGNTGKTRIAYSGTTNGVRYITSADQLPQNQALEAYDDAYFETKALILVTETVNSGSIQVAIKGVTVENGMACVTLRHEMPGDVGTDDMATWLLWAEVKQGLDYEWVLENPAMESESEEK